MRVQLFHSYCTQRTIYFHKYIYYRHHVRQMINMVSQVTAILCILMGVKINYINRYETLVGRNTAIQNTAFECVWTDMEQERREMFWKGEFANISNQRYWTFDYVCLHTVHSMSTVQVYSHKETFVWAGWIAVWTPFPLPSLSIRLFGAPRTIWIVICHCFQV